MFDLIKSDFDRKRELYHHHGSWFVRWVKNFIDPGGLALLVYRFGSWVNQLKIPVVKQCLRLLYIAVKMPVVLGFGIYIPSKATIGKGFVIHNMNGIFISTGVIGDDCTVQQGVTIGAIRPNKWQGKPRPPRLGKNVYLGAGAKVLGDISIGNNVVVGANSVVLTDIPDNVTVMGSPARIISRNTGDSAYGMPSKKETPATQTAAAS